MRFLTRFVVFNKFKFVREPSSDLKLVYTIWIVAPNFLSNESFVVFVDCDSLN
jgi:hypothetical protein